MSSATKIVKRNKPLPVHSLSIEIYSGIARFPCDSTAFLLKLIFCFSNVRFTKLAALQLCINTSYHIIHLSGLSHLHALSGGSAVVGAAVSVPATDEDGASQVIESINRGVRRDSCCWHSDIVTRPRSRKSGRLYVTQIIYLFIIIIIIIRIIIILKSSSCTIHRVSATVLSFQLFVCPAHVTRELTVYSDFVSALSTWMTPIITARGQASRVRSDHYSSPAWFSSSHCWLLTIVILCQQISYSLANLANTCTRNKITYYTNVLMTIT